MKNAPAPLFERAEGNARVTFLLSSIVASFHTIQNYLTYCYQQWLSRCITCQVACVQQSQAVKHLLPQLEVNLPRIGCHCFMAQKQTSCKSQSLSFKAYKMYIAVWLGVQNVNCLWLGLHFLCPTQSLPEPACTLTRETYDDPEPTAQLCGSSCKHPSSTVLLVICFAWPFH